MRASRPRDAPGTGEALFASLIRRGGPWLAVLGLTSCATTAAELLLPAALGRALDAALGGGRTTPWLVWSLALVAVLVCGEAVGQIASGYGAARASRWLRRRLLGHVLALGVRTAGPFRPGDLVSRVVGNAAEAGRAGVATAAVVTEAVLPVGSVVALGLIDPWLCVAFAAGLVVVAVLLRSFVRRASDLVARYQQTQGEIAGRLAEALAGARTIAAAGTADREARRVLAPLPALHAHGTRTWTTMATAAAQGAVAGPLLQISVVATGGLALAGGRLTPGALFAASQYAVLGAGLGGVVSGLGGVVRSRAGGRRAAEILTAPATRYGRRGLPPGVGWLEFRGVTVCTPDGQRILDSVDLVVPGGRATAVVGRSGAGKSVLAALAGRLLDPHAGEVLLDGVPLPDLSHPELRREVGSAFERPVLVGDTVAAAIALGQADPTDSGLRRAARAVCADSFVERLPDGYRTRLAEAPMSGGEVQRLGLARAWRAGRLLVLDDATSSLDMITEMQISRVLTGDDGRRTRLIVAHRAATAARADLVAWLDAGRVRAVGPHRQLWRDADYRAVFQPSPAPAAALDIVDRSTP